MPPPHIGGITGDSWKALRQRCFAQFNPMFVQEHFAALCHEVQQPDLVFGRTCRGTLRPFSNTINLRTILPSQFILKIIL
jgi:hypothetical protein